MSAPFALDTSGYVQGWVPAHGTREGYVSPHRVPWHDLSPFAQGYIEALFADADRTLGDAAAHDFGKMIAFSDLAPETLARIIADCEWLCTDASSRAASVASGREAWAVRQAGDMAHVAPLTVQLGDDGKVRFAS